MGIFDKLKNNKSDEIKNKKSEVRMSEAQLEGHSCYVNDLKSIIDGLSDFEKKYAHLCPPLGAPRTEDGLIDYSNMGVAYRRHLINFNDTIFAIKHYSRIPSLIKEISRYVSKDNRRLDKNDFLAIRKCINDQLDELENLCSTSYDYKAGIESVKKKCDKSLNEVKDELNQLEKNVNSLTDSNIFS